MMSRIAILLMAMAVARAAAADTSAGKPGLPEILPAGLETAIALSAAPPQLRDGVAIYRLGANGYELSRPGTNGFSCFVMHGSIMGPPGWKDSISGWCYDTHGMETLGKVDFDRASYARQGMPREEIRARINAGFAAGLYRAPQRPGVIYMLSPINKVPDHRNGRLYTYPPHVMYYAPNITNEDLGVPESVHTGDPGYVWSGLPFMPVTGPHGFIVQPLGELEGARIVEEHRELIEQVRSYVDLDLHDYGGAAHACHPPADPQPD